MRLGVLGGSFDPPHNAHLILARLAAEQLRLDRVLFMVAAAQPLKPAGHAADGPQRLRMVELAVAGIAGFVADDRELHRPVPSYTIDTLRSLRAEHQDADLVLLMGADVAHGFARWREPAAIRALAELAVCHRGGEPPPGGFEVAVTMPALEISSTTVRVRAARGLPLDGWVPRAVADYIGAFGIYGSRSG